MVTFKGNFVAYRVIQMVFGYKMEPFVFFCNLNWPIHKNDVGKVVKCTIIKSHIWF